MSAPPAAAATDRGPEASGEVSWGDIWRLSWPLVLTMIVNAAIGLLDTWVAGHVSPVAQAAVGLVMQLILLINATTTAVAIGAQALVSRFVGARAWAEAGRAAQQALLLGLILSLVVMPPMWVLAPYFFDAMGAPPAVRETGTWYLRALLLGLLPMDLGIVLGAIFRARGRTVALFAANLAEGVVWMSGSLVLGLWLGWGLMGLATGFVLGKLANAVIGFGLLRQMGLYKAIVEPWRVDWGWFRRILEIGLPAGGQVLIRNLGMMAYFGILGLLARPTEAVAAFSIGFRIESIAFLPVFALNIATATLVGQSLGAGRPDRAEAAVWRVATVGIVVMGAFAVFFWFTADLLAGVFTADPVVRGYAADYLRVIAISEPFLAIGMVINGGLQGAGDARAPMVAVFLFQILLRLPLAYALALGVGLGPSGAWWALTVSMIAQGIGITWYFRLGHWRTREI